MLTRSSIVVGVMNEGDMIAKCRWVELIDQLVHCIEGLQDEIVLPV